MRSGILSTCIDGTGFYLSTGRYIRGCYTWFLFSRMPKMLSKQYRLNKNLELEVYQLIPTAGKIIEFVSKWERAELQRIDTRYVIDEKGKFIKKSETRYQPQTYDINVLSQKEYNIWNGTETPLDTH